ncbi:serine/threonine protein kinase [Oscillatoriales cyanobacterium LEGE 11467]|uniref:Serine/threonine protein kinase n=1 Tax=Zarconia navalis LEGE 11467 TaxID=1828826 RepID=A0A928W008_9CYAN|nr:serine/threonine-protein kinase [Zarconia navalis]MBE9040805.1 serine/threonine protein kinase [Zarconia navalis LEGE 11467]
MNLTAGTVLQNGKYAIRATLGQGYFGTTYRAVHANLEQPVVIKTLSESLRHYAQFDRFQQRFIQQIQRIAQCQHSNLARVLDLFYEGGQVFAVMDYIPGPTLAQVMRTGQPLPIPLALYYIRQVGAALGVLHRNNVLHLDIKPDNIIRRSGRHRVIPIDFGISQGFTVGAAQTHAGLLSAGYAPLEQYDPQGKRTPATDVYALAATLYHLIAGQPPVTAPLRDRIPLPSPKQFQRDISSEVESAILQGLELNVEQRVPTVEAWLKLFPRESNVVREMAVAPTLEENLASKGVLNGKTARTAPKEDEPQPVAVARTAGADAADEIEIQETWRPGLRPWIPALFATTSLISGIGGASYVFSMQSNAASRTSSDRPEIGKSLPGRGFRPQVRLEDTSKEPEFVEEAIPSEPERSSWDDPSDYSADYPSDSREFSNTSEPASYQDEPTYRRYDRYEQPSHRWDEPQYDGYAPEPEPIVPEKPFIGSSESSLSEVERPPNAVEVPSPAWENPVKTQSDRSSEYPATLDFSEPKFDRFPVEKSNKPSTGNVGHI